MSVLPQQFLSICGRAGVEGEGETTMTTHECIFLSDEISMFVKQT